MAVLVVNNVNKSFGTSVILQDVSFSVNKNEKVAIIGDNGEGKTTLLKILTKQIEADSGSIIFDNPNSVGYLSQQVIEDEEHTLFEEMELAFSNLKQIEKEMEQLLGKMSDNPSNELIEKYSRMHEMYSNNNGYDYKYLIQQLLSKFGFSEDQYERKLKTFSGGERTRASFVKLLLKKPSVLLLDEPTNHLDLIMIEWLEKYLKSYNGAVIIVSHDQVFIDNLVDKVVELENHKSTVFSGNYTYYINEKQLRYEQALKAYNLQSKEIQRYEMLIRKFKPKPTKTAFAKSLETKLSKMDVLEKPSNKKKTIHAKFDANLDPVNVKMHICEDLLFGYDNKPLTEPFNIVIRNQDKICIMGQNGCGKTTLLNCMMTNVNKLSGFNSDVRTNLKYFYFDQTQQLLNPNLNLFDTIHEEFPLMTNTEVRTLLGRFLFEEDDVFKEVGSLSGGEKIRLIFAQISLRNYDILYLDEPTNHLDFTTKRVLSDILEDYPGTIIMVSHDRYFVNRVANRIIYIQKGKYIFEEGNYNDFIQKHDIQNDEFTFLLKKEEKHPQKETKSVSSKSNNSAKIKKQLEKELEDLMLELDEENEKLNDQSVEYNWIDYKEMHEKIENLENRINDVMVELEKIDA